MKKAGQSPMTLNILRAQSTPVAQRPTGLEQAVNAKRNIKSAVSMGTLGLPPEITDSAVATLMVQDAALAVKSMGKLDSKAVVKMLQRAVLEDTTPLAMTKNAFEVSASDVAIMVRRAQVPIVQASTGQVQSSNGAAIRALSHVKNTLNDKIDKNAIVLIEKLEELQVYVDKGEQIPSLLLNELKNGSGPLLEKAALTAFVRKEYANAMAPKDLRSFDVSLNSLSSAIFQAQMEASARQSEMLAEDARRSTELAAESADAQQELMSIAQEHRAGKQYDVRAAAFEVGVERAEVGEARAEYKDTRSEVKEARGEQKSTRSEVKEARGEQESTRSEVQEIQGEHRVDVRETHEARGEFKASRAEVKEARSEQAADVESRVKSDLSLGLSTAAAAQKDNIIAKAQQRPAQNTMVSPWKTAMLNIRFPGSASA